MGNEEYERIYSEFYPKVLQYLSGRVNIIQDAENLAQTVFLKVYTKADLFDEKKSSLSTWIFNITRNTLIDHQRSMSYRNHEELSETIRGDGEDILEGMIMEETLEQLADALEHLSEEERNLIILHYYSGCTMLKIAEMMDRPYGQIKRLHAKTLKKLRFCMGSDLVAT